DGSTKSIPQCGTPLRSSLVGFAVPISAYLYIALESALIISPPTLLASLIASAVLPLAVGPTITTRGASILMPQNYQQQNWCRSHLPQGDVRLESRVHHSSRWLVRRTD